MQYLKLHPPPYYCSTVHLMLWIIQFRFLSGMVQYMHVFSTLVEVASKRPLVKSSYSSKCSCFMNVSKKFPEHFSIVFREYFKGCSRVSQELFRSCQKSVPSVFQACSRVFQGCLKIVSKVFHECLMNGLKLFVCMQVIAATCLVKSSQV